MLNRIRKTNCKLGLPGCWFSISDFNKRRADSLPKAPHADESKAAPRFLVFLDEPFRNVWPVDEMGVWGKRNHETRLTS